MKKQLVYSCLFYFLLTPVSVFSFHLIDSVGLTTLQGKEFIVHEVEAGETLFALSRKYGISVQDIKDSNEASVESLSIGQRIYIPFERKKANTEGIVHTVKSSETLFSISRLYNVQVDDLKSWNGLTENNISVGQELVIKTPGNPDADGNTEIAGEADGRKTHVVEQSQTLYSISIMYNVTTDELAEWNNLTSNDLSIGQVLIVSLAAEPAVAVTTSASDNSSMLPSEEIAEESTASTAGADASAPVAVAGGAVIASSNEDNSPDTDTPSAPSEKITEKGLAEVIESTEDTKKYLALHRKAPIGTIMQVKNEMNGQSVFVRIVGTIPPTGDNAKLTLMISKKAYDRLGAIDKRFPVQISYIP